MAFRGSMANDHKLDHCASRTIKLPLRNHLSDTVVHLRLYGIGNSTWVDMTCELLISGIKLAANGRK